jgi:creatinine amidohydrolase
MGTEGDDTANSATEATYDLQMTGVRESKLVSLADMTWTEVRDRLPLVDVVLLPTGSIEQHGPHLPLLDDTLSAVAVCVRAAERMYPRLLVAPPVPFGDSSQWLEFPGTISIKAHTLVQLVVDICDSLAQHGFKRVIIVNGHGPNIHPLWEAAWRIHREVGIRVAYMSYWSLISPEVIQDVIETTIPGHADEFETSFALAAFPERVRREAIQKPEGAYDVPAKYTYLNSVYLTHFHTQVMTKIGFVGDPTLASAEKGRRLLDAAVEGLIEFLNYYMASPFAT